MKITELDEYQGLSIDMVDGWLSRNGWQPTDGDRLFERGPTVLRVFLHDDLVRLAAEHRLSPQSLVREINPRMRPWPSANARRGHSGPWLVTVAEDETGAIGRFGDEGWFHFNDSNILTEHEKFARYWPCDANGNKVRWPTDERGNML